MTDTLVTNSAVVVSRIEVLIGGVVVDVISEVLSGGYVTIDTTAENMRTANFSCLDPNGTLTPYANNSGELQPDGVEVAISVGFIVDGVPELWPQGVFGVQEVDVSTSAGGTDSGAGNFPGPGPNLTITAVDRSNRIAINLFSDSFTIPLGTPLAEAIELILTSQAPWCTNPNISPTDFSVAQQIYSPGDDPWQEIVALAAAGGMVAYFDASGILVVRPTPSLTGNAVAFALADGPDQVALSVTAVYSNSPGYNGVIVVNTSSASGNDTQLSGSAFDMDPASPTYALGPYEYRPAPPVTITSAASNAMCTAMAQGLLPQVLGRSNSVVVDNLPVPQADAYDLVYVDNATTGVDQVLILQQATIYLDYTENETMTLVPLGTPIINLAYLKGAPSAAAYGSTNPYYAGAGSVGYTPYSYTPYSYSSYGSSSGSHSAGSLRRGLDLLYMGDRLMRVTRHGLGGSGVDDSDDEDAVEDLADDLEDL